MDNGRVKNIVIVGGGTAGWMSAAALSKLMPKGQGNVTLVESEEIGTVGVGEATIPQIATFNERLGINEDDFIRETQATFKLGIEFVDWAKKGDRYFHPFGTHGFDLEGIEFHHYWNKLREQGDDRSIEDYSINAAAAYNDKFIRPQSEHGPIINKLGYAFHFDAILYAKFLRKFSEKNGAKRIEGKVEEVNLRSDNGFIESITLADGQKIQGDLFIDCTGFRGLLIEEALQTGYIDWSEYLPVDSAVAIPCEKIGEPIPYTRSTAREAGWQWRIPLQHRTGNGYVYCSKYQSKDEAEITLLSNLDGKPLASPKHLRFKTGRRKKFWSKNCVAIGLSAGFMEPLESTSIHLIQSGISKLIALFPDKSMNPVERDEYNRLLDVGYAHIRDFLILHYTLTTRDDSDFWNYVRTMKIPDSLKRKMALIESRGRFFKYDDELFNITSWMAVAIGQGYTPKGYNPMVDSLSDDNIKRSLSNIRAAINKAVEAMPTQQTFIDKFCKAKDVYTAAGENI